MLTLLSLVPLKYFQWLPLLYCSEWYRHSKVKQRPTGRWSRDGGSGAKCPWHSGVPKRDSFPPLLLFFPFLKWILSPWQECESIKRITRKTGLNRSFMQIFRKRYCILELHTQKEKNYRLGSGHLPSWHFPHVLVWCFNGEGGAGKQRQIPAQKVNLTEFLSQWCAWSPCCLMKCSVF